MKAAIYSNSEPSGLQIVDVEKPAPSDNEVLIKVRAASLNPLDSHLLRHPFMRPVLSAMSKQKSTGPGRDVAGEVEAVGGKVSRFKPGDAVFGSLGGAFAEYVCAPERALVVKPANVTFEQATSAPIAGLTALQGLRDKGQVQPGQKVLINGAAGGVGTFAVQVAKSLGADVTGICSTRNVEMVRSIGADHVVDYTQEDVTKSGQLYDVMFDLVANHSLSARRRILSPKGIYVGAGVLGLGGSMLRLLAHQAGELVLSPFASQKFVTLMAKLNQQDLTILGELISSGKVTPVIDRRYTLSQVPEALRYLAEGHARGKVIISLGT
ncbi:MAG: NAD(P)-dependent alcohol dehydrogenase [Acidobacteriota bacterium]|nr:NAD(P)-dependent alcohol dehydrogenase [Acidobacteriota bacterium]